MRVMDVLRIGNLPDYLDARVTELLPEEQSDKNHAIVSRAKDISNRAAFSSALPVLEYIDGGEGGIRTLGPVARSTH